MRLNRFHFRLLAGIAIALGVATCVASFPARESRLSGAVALVARSPEVQSFLRNPGTGYVQGFVRFGADMPDDVIMFVDQEWLEGVDQPKHVKGGDWMAVVGVQRGGAIWVGAGTGAALPSKERDWKIFDLRQRLQADMWYRLRVVADFGQRRFKSFTIEGGALNRTFDLHGLPLDYPNYMPFSRAGMVYIVGAMRGRNMMKQVGTPIVYLDDVEGGIVRPDGTTLRLFFDSFERQDSVGAQPVTSPIIQSDRYEENKWYLERSESLFRIEKVPFARTGARVGVADTDLN